MREAINSNPLVQVAIVGVLLVATGFFVMSSMGGGEEEPEGGATEATVSVVGTEASGTATGTAPGEAVEGARRSRRSGDLRNADFGPAPSAQRRRQCATAATRCHGRLRSRPHRRPALRARGGNR